MLILQKQKMICFLVSVLKYYTQKHLKTLCFLHVFLYMYLKTVKNLQFLAFLYDLGIARKKEHVIPTSFRPIPLQFQKTSSFPLLQK